VQDIYESQPRDLMRIVSALPADAERVLLFGHNPTLTEFANRFTQQAIDNIPTCGIVRIDSDAPDWASFYEGNASVKACWFPKLVLR
jgi:phosphohistidine phosphatase